MNGVATKSNDRSTKKPKQIQSMFTGAKRNFLYLSSVSSSTLWAPVETTGSRGTLPAGGGGGGARPHAATAFFLGPFTWVFGRPPEGMEEAAVLEPAIAMSTARAELGAAAAMAPWTTWLPCHFRFTPAAEGVGAAAGNTAAAVAGG